MNYLFNLPFALILQRIIVIVTNVKLIIVHLVKKLMMEQFKPVQHFIPFEKGWRNGLNES